MARVARWKSRKTRSISRSPAVLDGSGRSVVIAPSIYRCGQFAPSTAAAHSSRTGSLEVSTGQEPAHCSAAAGTPRTRITPEHGSRHGPLASSLERGQLNRARLNKSDSPQAVWAMLSARPAPHRPRPRPLHPPAPVDPQTHTRQSIAQLEAPVRQEIILVDHDGGPGNPQAATTTSRAPPQRDRCPDGPPPTHQEESTDKAVSGKGSDQRADNVVIPTQHPSSPQPRPHARNHTMSRLRRTPAAHTWSRFRVSYDRKVSSRAVGHSDLEVTKSQLTQQGLPAAR